MNNKGSVTIETSLLLLFSSVIIIIFSRLILLYIEELKKLVE